MLTGGTECGYDSSNELRFCALDRSSSRDPIHTESSHGEHLPVVRRWETHASSDGDGCRRSDGQVGGEEITVSCANDPHDLQSVCDSSFANASSCQWTNTRLVDVLGCSGAVELFVFYCPLSYCAVVCRLREKTV